MDVKKCHKIIKYTRHIYFYNYSREDDNYCEI